MRRLLLAAPLLAALVLACHSKTPVGPGTVTITETTTSTTTSTTTTSTIPLPTTSVFTFSPQTPQVNQLISFDGTGSMPGTGRKIVDYSFDFGDASLTAEGPHATHFYTISGTYLVTLTVKDDSGAKAKSSLPVTVRPAGP
ncbi:MAG: PKD domain-containing protein [Vicinamibacterales bacterium]